MKVRAPILLLTLCLFAGTAARADTTCSVGGSTPAFAARMVTLQSGSDFVTIQLSTAMPSSLPAGDRASWHLVAGFAVVDASTGRLVVARGISLGSSTRRVVVESDGTAVAREDVVAPDAPFKHELSAQITRLDPGTYYVIGFGTDGDARSPNQIWGADFHFSAATMCKPVGTGEVFDIDATRFSGGTQVSTPVAGASSGERASMYTARGLVFGLMDVHAQFAGSASLGYSFPDGSSDTLSNTIVPFTGGPGEYAFTSDYAAAFPVTEIAGVMLDP
ncbi:MAG: hypothetical protein ABR552_07470 [Actinomycetota bacterium]